MTDVMDRLAAANPAQEDERPAIDEIWRKIDAESAVADRAPWRRRGGRALLIASAALPVIAVVLIALSARGARPAPSRPSLKGGHHHLKSTIDPAVQRSAVHALGVRSGSVVVMNPQTGAIEAMATAGSLRGGAHALVPPGATFDVVTLATALSTGRYRPESRVSGASPLGAGRSQVTNEAGQNFGRISLADALTFSVNTVFGRVGLDLGAAALTRQMRLFALPSRPGSEGPASVGALAAGQGSMLTTPLQLATVAAAIANGGRLAQPHATSPAERAPVHTVMAPQTARLLTQMLRRVVTQGTGTAANLGGLDIAGKTGTAPARGSARGTVASFIGFAPADHPTVAIAVVLNIPRGGFGGTAAAPIAARVIRDVLRGHR